MRQQKRKEKKQRATKTQQLLVLNMDNIWHFLSLIRHFLMLRFFLLHSESAFLVFVFLWFPNCPVRVSKLYQSFFLPLLNNKPWIAAGTGPSTASSEGWALLGRLRAPDRSNCPLRVPDLSEHHPNVIQRVSEHCRKTASECCIRVIP